MSMLKEIPEHKKLIYVFYFFLILFIALRLIGITNDLSDFHHFRQTYTALFSKYFYENGMDILKPNLDILNYKNVSEFHSYTYLVAIGYKIFGYHVIIGRIISILFSIGTFFLFYKLLKDLFDEYTALIATYLLTILPLSIFYSRVFMLESMMLFLSVGMVYFSAKYITTNQNKYFLLGILFSSMTFLIKIPTLYMMLPIVYLFFTKYRFSILINKYFYAFTFFSLIPAIFWYFIYPKFFADNKVFDNSLMSVYYSRDAWEFYIQLMKDPATYKGIFLISIAEYHLGLVGFFFMLGGIILLFLNLFRKTQNNLLYSQQIWVFFYWAIGFCVFIFMFIAPNLAHEYYQLPIQLPAIALAAYCIRVSYTSSRPFIKYAIIFLLLGLIPFSYVKLKGRLQIDPFYENFGKRVQEIVPEQEKIIAMDNMPRSEVFYFSKRKGYQLIVPGALSYFMVQVPEEIKNQTFAELNSHITEGATYFVIPYYEFVALLPWMKEYMDTHHECVLGCDITKEQSINKDPSIPGYIYKLKK